MSDKVHPGVISGNLDLNAVDNVIYVQLSDGSAGLSVTAGVLDVSISNATIAVTQSGTWTIDSITNDVSIDDGGNSITVDGTVAVSGITGSVTVTATDLDIRALDHVTIGDSVRIGDGVETLAVNTDGSINVNIVSASISGEVHDFDTVVDAVKAVASNHDYTVANTTMLLKSVIVSASGNAKFEIQVGALASLATVAVGFLTGREGDTKQINFDPAIEVPVTSTGTVRVVRTNLENQAQDLYSTIIGQDV